MNRSRADRKVDEAEEDAVTVTHTKRKRLSASDRRQDILTKAIDYFARVGFDGGTRELARELGVAQPLLYRHFPNKDALIQEIYNVVYLDQWQPSWDGILTDRTRPLRERLQQFYEEYTDAILQPHWMRIYFFAGLKGVSINERYLDLVEKRILSRIIDEFHHEQRCRPDGVHAAEDMEIAWGMQGGIFYYGVRKYVYGSPTYVSKAEMISNALDVFFAGYRSILQKRNGSGQANTKS